MKIITIVPIDEVIKLLGLPKCCKSSINKNNLILIRDSLSSKKHIARGLYQKQIGKKNKENIYSIVKKHHKGISSTEIAEKLGLSTATTIHKLRELKKERRINVCGKLNRLGMGPGRRAQLWVKR